MPRARLVRGVQLSAAKPGRPGKVERGVEVRQPTARQGSRGEARPSSRNGGRGGEGEGEGEAIAGMVGGGVRVSSHVCNHGA